MRIAAAAGGIGLLIMSIGLPLATWSRGGTRVGGGTWVAVAIVSLVAAQCGRNLLRVAKRGRGPRWLERDSL
jgi:hypothetical protein